MPLSPIEDRAAAMRHCIRHTEKLHAARGRSFHLALLEREADILRNLVERSLNYRAGMIALDASLRKKLALRVPLSGEDLATLKHSEALHLQLRAELIALAAAHECWLGDDAAARWKKWLGPPERGKGILLSLASAIVLYDNYLLAMSLYQNSGKLRRYLNNPDIGYGIESGELHRSSLSFVSAANRRRMRQALVFYEREAAARRPAWGGDETMRYLDLVIAQSSSYAATRRPSLVHYLGDRIELFGVLTQDTLARLRDEGVHLLSMLFGDAIGLFEIRRGKLFGQPALQNELERLLEPGDILLERTPFRLTDAFIPGHWGHSAIWVGTEADLRLLELWNEPVVSRHHEAIRERRMVVEALRSGVKLNRLDRFLNVDDLAVLRLRQDARRERRNAIIQALRQVGKHYDFLFDVETTDRIVCSELIYDAYPAIAWHTARLLGRSTITPDDIAEASLRNRSLLVVRVYHDGRLMTGPPAAAMAQLLRRLR